MLGPRQISIKTTESVRQTNMSYKRCLTGPCERLKAETGKRGSDRHDRPNPLQDILVIVENIRGNILSISFLIPWDSCLRNQQKGTSDSQGNTKFPLVSAMRRATRSSKEIGSLRNCPTSLGLEYIRSNTSLFWMRFQPQA
jgi:hypothetical protein